MTNSDPKRLAVDLLGPTVTRELRKAIKEHGVLSVQMVVKEIGKIRRGRKPAPDWDLLAPFLERDIEEWLQGGNPFKDHSNYSISQAFAAKHVGHSPSGTAKRILGKLKNKDSRKVRVLLHAWHRSLRAYPYNVHLKSLEELSLIQPDGPWELLLDEYRLFLAEYAAQHGSPPESRTMQEIIDTAAASQRLISTGLLVPRLSQTD